ncbi:hypothetical protein FKM82_001502 [Ascaphus truei]
MDSRAGYHPKQVQIIAEHIQSLNTAIKCIACLLLQGLEQTSPLQRRLVSFLPSGAQFYKSSENLSSASPMLRTILVSAWSIVLPFSSLD